MKQLRLELPKIFYGFVTIMTEKRVMHFTGAERLPLDRLKRGIQSRLPGIEHRADAGESFERELVKRSNERVEKWLFSEIEVEP